MEKEMDMKRNLDGTFIRSDLGNILVLKWNTEVN